MPEEITRKSSSGSTCMRCIKRESVTESFQVKTKEPIPSLPTGGARIRVCYAGACYTDQQVVNSGQKKLRNPGVHDTSLFPGYEISGVIDEICNTLHSGGGDNRLQPGDRVVVYPENEEITKTSFEEYISIRNIENLIKVPESLSLDVASLLPCGALTAYTAVLRAKAYIEEKRSSTNDTINILVVGAGGLGLWTIQIAKYYICQDSCNVHITVADTCIEKLMVAKNYGCYDVVHWNDTIHEEHLVTRTMDVCPQGIDVIIDFVTSPRTISRSMKVLKQHGVMVVGGNSKYEVSMCLNTLAKRNQTIVGVGKGSRKHLEELIEVCASGKIKPPCYSVFPVDKANQVFQQLDQCKIYGRAVLKVSESDESSARLCSEMEDEVVGDSSEGHGQNNNMNKLECRSVSTESRNFENIVDDVF